MRMNADKPETDTVWLYVGANGELDVCSIGTSYGSLSEASIA